MLKSKIGIVAVISLALAVPAHGTTHKSSYTESCATLWPAVKDTLDNPDNYKVVESDDARMRAVYGVHHTTHVTITGAALQRKNHVTLIPRGTGCEMQVISNYSGFEHNDQGDFKKRVDESLEKLKALAPTAAPTK